MPEKYELFLDKNKKVKLSADDQGNFFAEASGKKIKLGVNGLEAINEAGTPEAIGGAVSEAAVWRTSKQYGNYEVLAERLDLNGNPETIDITQMFQIYNSTDGFYYSQQKVDTSGYFKLAAEWALQYYGIRLVDTFSLKDASGWFYGDWPNSIFTKIIFNIYDESSCSIDWTVTLSQLVTEWEFYNGYALSDVDVEFNYHKKQVELYMGSNISEPWYRLHYGKLTVNYLSGISDVWLESINKNFYSNWGREIYINLNNVDNLDITATPGDDHPNRNQYISSRGYDWVQEMLNSITSLGVASGHSNWGQYGSQDELYYAFDSDISYIIPIEKLKDGFLSSFRLNKYGFGSSYTFKFPEVFNGEKSFKKSGITVDPNISTDKLIELCRIASKRNAISEVIIKWPTQLWNKYYLEYQYVNDGDPFVADNIGPGGDFLSNLIVAFNLAFNPQIGTNNQDLGNGQIWRDYAPSVYINHYSWSSEEYNYWTGTGPLSNTGLRPIIEEIMEFTEVFI